MSSPRVVSPRIVIVGAGMAGASLAALVMRRAGEGAIPARRITLIEAESHPGYHTTGRSAAFWSESYGGPGVQPLTTMSGPVLAALGVLSARGAVTLARAGEEEGLEAFARRYEALGVRVERLDRAACAARIPGLREHWVAGVFEPECRDIDVAALHQHYLSEARRAGVELICDARLAEARRRDGQWRLRLADGRELAADLLVNAAGAWADAVAEMAGAHPLGIAPLRRTMAQLRVSPPPAADLPLVLDLAESFYFKPESGRLWLTPHDETPSPPCDAAPEEIDVATAIARLEQVVDWRVERVEHRWAGLRSFAPDRLPVYGWDVAVEGFFWFAGQGGFGIQTAPAAADLAARLILGEGPGAIAPEPYSLARFG